MKNNMDLDEAYVITGINTVMQLQFLYGEIALFALCSMSGCLSLSLTRELPSLYSMYLQ